MQVALERKLVPYLPPHPPAIVFGGLYQLGLVSCSCAIGPKIEDTAEQVATEMVLGHLVLLLEHFSDDRELRMYHRLGQHAADLRIKVP